MTSTRLRMALDVWRHDWCAGILVEVSPLSAWVHICVVCYCFYENQEER